MSENNYLDDLLSEVASGRTPPQEALNRFFLHKKAEADATLTEADQAFITAMDAVETAHAVAKWCARNAAAQGGVTAIHCDLRRPGFFRRRQPPLVTGLSMGGQRMMLFSTDGPADGSEYAEDCRRVAASFTGAFAEAVYLPVFVSALETAFKGHGLPAPEVVR